MPSRRESHRTDKDIAERNALDLAMDLVLERRAHGVAPGPQDRTQDDHRSNIPPSSNGINGRALPHAQNYNAGQNVSLATEEGVGGKTPNLPTWSGAQTSLTALAHGFTQPGIPTKRGGPQLAQCTEPEGHLSRASGPY